jgi:ferrous iron transport protein A
LSELEPGCEGSVVKVGGKGPVRRRILDMGVVVGSGVRVERVAPLGDPVAIRVKGYILSLRKEEAVNVYIEVDE